MIYPVGAHHRSRPNFSDILHSHGNSLYYSFALNKDSLCYGQWMIVLLHVQASKQLILKEVWGCYLHWNLRHFGFNIPSIGWFNTQGSSILWHKRWHVIHSCKLIKSWSVKWMKHNQLKAHMCIAITGSALGARGVPTIDQHDGEKY